MCRVDFFASMLPSPIQHCTDLCMLQLSAEWSRRGAEFVPNSAWVYGCVLSGERRVVYVA